MLTFLFSWLRISSYGFSTKEPHFSSLLLLSSLLLYFLLLRLHLLYLLLLPRLPSSFFSFARYDFNGSMAKVRWRDYSGFIVTTREWNERFRLYSTERPDQRSFGVVLRRQRWLLTHLATLSPLSYSKITHLSIVLSFAMAKVNSPYGNSFRPSSFSMDKFIIFYSELNGDRSFRNHFRNPII